WDLEIEKAMTTATSMIAVLSTASIASPNFMDEVSYALEKDKRIIPVLLSDVETPFRLRRLQRIDFTTDYDIGFRSLLNALQLQGDDDEDKSWQKAKTENSKNSYQSYLQSYPNGKYIVAASKALNEFDKNVAEKQKASKEMSLWTEACEMNTISSFEEYLRNT